MNNELIKVTYDNNRPTVLGRELHERLEIKTAYKDWFPRMCEYGFTEGVDFNPLKNEQVRTEGERTVSRTITDHQLTIEMAKEICMIQRSEIGKKFRQYFIDLEKQWNTPEAVMARALQYANHQLAAITQQNKTLTDKIEADKPKVLFADSVTASQTSILIGELAKLIKQNGVEMGQKRMFAYPRENGYLIKRKGTDYNMPTQKAMDLELFEIKETSITHSDGHISVSKTPKVTGKGQVYFINKFIGTKDEPQQTEEVLA